jgi:hypothetical protein
MQALPTLKVACSATPSRFDRQERRLELFGTFIRMRHEMTACQVQCSVLSPK